MDNETNPHFRLKEMGVDTWNRWAVTVMGHEKIDALNVSDGRKSELKSIIPIQEEEKTDFANSLGIDEFDELLYLCDFSQFSGAAGFDDFLFPTGVMFSGINFNAAAFQRTIFNQGAIFSDVSFNDLASFGEATFNAHAVFENVVFRGTAEFSNTTYVNEANFTNVTFEKRVNFYDANLKLLRISQTRNLAQRQNL